MASKSLESTTPPEGRSTTPVSRSVSAPPRSLTAGVLLGAGAGAGAGAESEANKVLMERYVRAALAKGHHRDPAAYAFVLGQLRNPQRPHIVAEWLRALGTSASALTMDNAREFLVAIFRLDFTADRELQAAVLSLVTDIATCHSTYIPQMMRALMMNFNPQRSSVLRAAAAAAAAAATAAHTAAGGNTMATAEAREAQQRAQEEQASAALATLGYDVDKSRAVRGGIVDAVQEILRLVPLASTCVWQTFLALYPHKTRDVVVHEAWLDAAFDICRCAPSIREPIIGTVLSHLLDMDVELRVDEDDTTTTATAATAATAASGAAGGGDDDAAGLVFQIELDSRSSTPAPGQPPAALSPTPPPLGAAGAESANRALAGKLDKLMVRLLTHVGARLGGTGAGATPLEDFNILLRHFVHSVLPVYSCKTTQFVVFYACHFDPRFADAFLATLMRVARDESVTPAGVNAGIGTMTPLVNRVSACAYVASFLARANFLTPATTEKYLRELIGLARQYTREFEAALPATTTDSTATATATAGAIPIKRNSSNDDDDDDDDDGSGRSASLPSFRDGAVDAAMVAPPPPVAPPVPSHTLVIDPNMHQLFYAATQAAMYVFCYTSARLLAAARARGTDADAWLRALGLEDVLASPLSPLTMCNAAVVDEFRATWRRAAAGRDTLGAAAARTHARLAVITNRGVSVTARDTGLTTLEALFPFDPYLLKESSAFIDPIYNMWTEDDDDNDGNDDDAEEEGEEGDNDDGSDDVSEGEGEREDDGADSMADGAVKTEEGAATPVGARIKVESARAAADDDDDDEGAGCTPMSVGPVSATRLRRPMPMRAAPAVPITFSNFNFAVD